MHSFSFMIGVRTTSSRGRRFSKQDDARLRELTAQYFPKGFTILNAAGGWFDPKRARFIEEESRQILICTEDRRALRAWCGELAKILHQQELLIVELGTALIFRYNRKKPAKA